MRRSLWALCFFWLLWVAGAASARADEIRVCARPPDVKPDIGRWAYSGGGQVLTTASATEFQDKSRGFTVYVFDPAAPPDSVKMLPARYSGLTCAGGKPAPRPPPSASATHAAAPKPAQRAGTSPTQGNGSSATHGATGKAAKGDKKTTGEKVAAELAIAGAIAAGQMNEDLKNPAGKKYGVPGGKNPNGINNPFVQAAAGAVLAGTAVASAAGFEKKLIDALRKKTPLLLDTMTEKVADALAQHWGADIAHALNVNGAIGVYKVMAKFTDRLGGRWQAHHILEARFVRKFKLGNADDFPAVLLTDVEHKAITKKLKEKTAGAETLKELWQGYKEAYKEYPHWLKAIESKLGSGK